ncbi:MAG: hydroxyacylglutathione hydrolase [Lentimonas sp.]|jgi:hydroxyacylglutathione hydrolase
MGIQIEDNFEDVLNKAARGQGLSLASLVERTGLSRSAIQHLLEGQLNLPHLRQLASALGLAADKLAAMAEGAWYPSPVSIEGLRAYNTACPVPGYVEMTVNNYLIYDPATRAGVLFDTGADPEQLLADLERESLQLKALFLTHTHRDHLAAYREIIDATGCACYTPAAEPISSAQPVVAGASFQFGGLGISARDTSGHSAGGTTYLVEGLKEAIAVVGDSIFCLSMGKAYGAYEQALRNNREQILSLPATTILCPGHGPMTTVAEQHAFNPFFGSSAEAPR